MLQEVDREGGGREGAVRSSGRGPSGALSLLGPSSVARRPRRIWLPILGGCSGGLPRLRIQAALAVSSRCPCFRPLLLTSWRLLAPGVHPRFLMGCMCVMQSPWGAEAELAVLFVRPMLIVLSTVVSVGCHWEFVGGVSSRRSCVRCRGRAQVATHPDSAPCQRCSLQPARPISAPIRKRTSVGERKLVTTLAPHFWQLPGDLGACPGMSAGVFFTLPCSIDGPSSNMDPA